MYTGIVLSDLHFGINTCKPEELLVELRRGLFSYMQTHTVNYVIVTGHLISGWVAVDQVYVGVVTFFQELLDLARERGIKVRFIHGLYLNEAPIVKSFNAFHNKVQEALDTHDVDYRMITKIEKEDLFPGMRVLYLPDEDLISTTQFHKYRDKFFMKENEYEYIFGYGRIAEIYNHVNMFSESPVYDNKVKSDAPTLAKICTQGVFFGMIKTPINYGDKIQYVGSYSTWGFEFNDKRGFYYLSYNPTTRTNKKEFVLNEHRKKSMYRQLNVHTMLDETDLLLILAEITDSISYDFINNGIYTEPPAFVKMDFYIHTGMFKDKILLENRIKNVFGDKYDIHVYMADVKNPEIPNT